MSKSTVSFPKDEHGKPLPEAWKNIRAASAMSLKRDPSDLPQWAKMGMLYHDAYSETWEEAAQRFGKAGQTLRDYAWAPAGQKWRSAFSSILANPVQAAEVALKASALNMTLEYVLVYEMAKSAGDYKEQRLIIQDWLNRSGVQQQGAALQDFRPTIVVNVQGGAKVDAASFTAIPMGESEHELIKDADFEVEET